MRIKHAIIGFIKKFKDFKDFQSPGQMYLEEERDYKEKAINSANEILENSSNYIDVFDKIIDLTNFWNWRDKAHVRTLYTNPKFISGIEKLFHLATSTDNVAIEKYESMSNDLIESGIAYNMHKQTITYVFFIYNFHKYLMLKSDILDKALLSNGIKKIGRGRYLDYQSFEKIVELGALAQSELAEYKPKDMIDIQSFLYVMYKKEFNDLITIDDTRIWWVCQGDTYADEMRESQLWASNENVWHHLTMKELEIGDIVIHYSQKEIVAVSIVTKECDLRDRTIGTDAWGDEGLLVETKYYPLIKAITIEELNQIMDDLIGKQPEKHAPFNNSKRVNQVYLAKFNWDAFKCILKHFKNGYFSEEFLAILGDIYKNLQIEIIDDLAKSVTLENQEFFNNLAFMKSVKNANLIISKMLIGRFVSSLQTKPFLILTGLAGSGKTKLAEAFSLWITENPEQYCMVSVGADWTNREPLLGFPNALEKDSYVKPESGVLDLIINASRYRDRPYFLILDEMNMSHVERYFADFLSSMESTDKEMKLHSGSEDWNGVPPTITLPDNLFIIGTVNIDETTYMFSPKVLDRASVIEFRVSQDEIRDFFATPAQLNMESLRGKGASMGESFVKEARKKVEPSDKLGEKLLPFFTKLQEAGAEFGYRTASEISRFVTICEENGKDFKLDSDDVIDAAIMQKLLPKVHGSRNKIEKILKELGALCLVEEKRSNVFSGEIEEEDIKYKISYDKLKRMHTRVIADGFTSYAEA